MKGKSTTQEILAINPAQLTLHAEALATPKMSATAYEALKKDIEINGQLDPVLVYRGKIIDGRHRWLILSELEAPEIKYILLPNNTTLAEIRRLVQSKETRRHETAGQLAIRAYRLKTQPNSPYKSLTDAADSVGAHPKRVGEVKKIVEMYGRNDIIELLFNGEQFNTGTIRIPFWTDSLPTILRWLAEHGTVVGATQKAAAIKPRRELTMDEELYVDSMFNTAMGEATVVIEALAERLYAYAKEGRELGDRNAK